MYIIFHDAFYRIYAGDPAAGAGRMEPIIQELQKYPHYTFVTPEPASQDDLHRAHTKTHIETIQGSPGLYEMAALAAGGAIKTAELGCAGEPSFGCIRPPGHHASAASCWGFCFFNNMAVSLLKLMAEEKIRTAFILDFDLHRGDGNINILGDRAGISILNPSSGTEEEYLFEIASVLDQTSDCDIIAASAGFDAYVDDWGGKLTTESYREIGAMMKSFAEKHCQGKRYALLEGGYHYKDLGKNVHAFCEGFR